MPSLNFDSSTGHITVLLILLVGLTLCDYYHITPNQMILGALLLALNVKPRTPADVLAQDGTVTGKVTETTTVSTTKPGDAKDVTSGGGSK